MDAPSKIDAGPGEREAPAPSRLAALWRSLVGRKALMAATGLVLFGYVVVHLLGNLLAFAGPARLDRYAASLRELPVLLWSVRALLLVAALVHVVAGADLWVLRHRTRPVAYRDWQPAGSTPAARTMAISGFLVLGFVVYHLLDLTFGVVNPDFRTGQPFHNVVVSFSRASAVALYVLAVAGLGFHLWHGLFSATQSLGLATGPMTPGLRRAAAVLGTLLAVGFAAVPLGVLFGLVG